MNCTGGNVVSKEQGGDQEAAEDEEQVHTGPSKTYPGGITGKMASHDQQDGNSTESIELGQALGRHEQRFGQIAGESLVGKLEIRAIAIE